MKKTDKITPHRGQINYIDFHYRLSVSHEQARREFSKENYELIKKYDSVLLASSVAISTRSNYANWLVMMTKLLKKNWADITKEDVDDLVVNIMKNHGNHKGQESASTNSLKNALKAFVRWIKLDSRSFKKVGDPPETKSIVVKPVHNTLQKENLVTDKDRANMITACTGNLRNQAFIDVICDAGPRAGEILTLQLKHVKRDKYGIILAVDGKTGPHPIRLVKSIGRLTVA